MFTVTASVTTEATKKAVNASRKAIKAALKAVVVEGAKITVK